MGLVVNSNTTAMNTLGWIVTEEGGIFIKFLLGCASIAPPRRQHRYDVAENLDAARSLGQAKRNTHDGISGTDR